MDRVTQRRSVSGDIRLHGEAQVLDQFRIERMRRRIGPGVGAAAIPIGGDCISARMRCRRPGLDLGIDIGRHDGNGIVAVAEDLESAELLRKIPQRGDFDLPEAIFRMGRVR